nr:testis-expressed protein 12 isoform X1 [Anser cygnoides]
MLRLLLWRCCEFLSQRGAESPMALRGPSHKNEATENPQLSSTDKTDVSFSEGSQSLYKPEPLEEVLNEMNKEIKNLLSKYAHILSERAAMDASYVQELDGILKEARTLENHLKQKRESLKQRFTVIANTLQS